MISKPTIRHDTLAEHNAHAKRTGVDHGWKKSKSFQYEPNWNATDLTSPWQFALLKEWNNPIMLQNLTCIYDVVGGAGKSTFIQYCDENLSNSVVELRCDGDRAFQYKILQQLIINQDWLSSRKFPNRTITVYISQSDMESLTEPKIIDMISTLDIIRSHYKTRVLIFANSPPPKQDTCTINVCEIKNGEIACQV
jgi:hypothetical protein